MSYDHVKILRSGYEAFARQDIGRILDEVFAEDIEWIEPQAEGNPFSGTRIGALTVATEVFALIPQYFSEFSVEPERFVEVDDDDVIVTGRYRALSLNGVRVDEPFVHQWTVRDGRAVRMEALTNTAALVAAISPEVANRSALLRIYEAFTSGRLDDLDDAVSPDAVDHNPEPGQEAGLAGLKESMAEFRTAFPDLAFTPQEVIACGDRVVARTRLSGTHRGDLAGLPATNREVSIDLIDIVRFEDGKAVERWGLYDGPTMMAQLGLTG
jgi:steroid delta-isomerase-like uncharacterized protein